MKKLCLLVCLSIGLSATAFAEGNAEAGKTKSVTCAACHGADGNSPVDMYPKLAGQHAEYIIKQLHEFKQASESNGEEGRNDPVMNGMAAPLSDQDIEDLAAYFSSQKAKPGATPEDVIEAGQRLFRGGDAERNITACAACHGPRGNGMGLAKFPDISGQHATYVKAQLEKFREGGRANDPNGMMQDIAKHLSDKDIDILSKYVGGLH
ncbi:c-type cytochrome [Neptunicella sp. SCSIO 80796]|uniref:c-type cytochrome n=1 Tax=Neptunicella plasticusilytica TaxID=3117012 RepID=UPI003A4E3D1F